MNRKLTMFALMTNKEIHRHYLLQLQQLYSRNEADVVTGWVFEKIAGLNRGDLVKNPGQLVDADIFKQLTNALDALLQHKPVQYVLNEAWFYKLKLVVNEQVLIPRPETEELVKLIVDDWTLKASDSTGDHISMIDIGTGSGCIALALKKNLPAISMHAVDISKGALSVAKQNAISHNLAIEFQEINFLDASAWKELPVVDVIVSNPPYIPANEESKMDENVTKYEPHTALFVSENEPIIFYEKLAAFGLAYLKSGGKIYAEMHEDYAQKTASVFENYYTTAIKHDLFGKQRMLVATRK